MVVTPQPFFDVRCWHTDKRHARDTGPHLPQNEKNHDYTCLLATFLLYLRHQYELANHLLSTAYEKICTKTNSDAPAHSPWWNERMGTRVELYFSL